MTDGPLLGIENSRSNWDLEELDVADAALLWRTDGPGHFIAVHHLNGWYAGLFHSIDIGPGLALPVQIRVDVAPEDVADRVEELQTTAESLTPVDRDD